MKITIYTITDCAFSKQEKEYLSAHGLQFEEKNLETNREFLTEMLAVGSNFAGTPVTKIEKDDGQIAVLKGFTPMEFDKTLGFTPAPQGTESVQPVEATQAQQVVAPVEVPPVPVVIAPVEQPVVPTPQSEIPQAQTAPIPVVTDPAMASVLNTLEQQVQAAVPNIPIVAQPPIPPPVVQAVNTPVIPDPQF